MIQNLPVKFTGFNSFWLASMHIHKS